MNQLTTVGVDLAKDVFAVCVLDVTGAVIERRVLRRDAFIKWAERLSPCRVAMEAFGSAHHWGRWFSARGHTPCLIAAEFVKPFRLGGKNDAADAEAIAIAGRQPTMRFVAIKSVEQQAILAWHSVRAGWQEERTALLNRTRGLLAEFGVVIARSADRLLAALPGLVDDARLPDPVRTMLLEVREQLVALNARLAGCDRQIASHARSSDVARRASELLGGRSTGHYFVGPTLSPLRSRT
jgi:transposase